ncbi:MAG: hypothetical protein KF816_03420 [Melioribacteraceae bacterium]|nr:hypothetical protein [Melioribacteraceae bacterium]
MKKSNNVVAGLIFINLLFTGIVSGQSLAGTDELGRTLLLNDSVGNLQKSKNVAIFYFLWHDEGLIAGDAWDLSEIVAEHPEVLNDFDNPNWGIQQPGTAYYWGQPLYGYYRAEDYWVSLRSVQLLTDAGVDILVIDATNKETYGRNADVLMKAMDAVRAQGKNPPKIVFYTNTESGFTMQQAYDNFYKQGAKYYHPECWFYLEGKPLIIGISSEAKGMEYENFFTYRESQWPTEKYKTNSWPWIAFTRPQQVHFNAKGEKEIVNVAVAQHPNPKAGMGGSAFYGNRDNWGRSHRNGYNGNPEVDIRYGYNMQEQWDFAIKENPPFVYVTGWNEWIAGKFPSKDSNPEHSWFCDQASPEYSRDIEPTRTAGLKDNYYMQLVNNIRRYKGVEASAAVGKSISTKSFDDWKNVEPVYIDYIGDTGERNCSGMQKSPKVIYTNNTGRNDFHQLKISRDSKYVYFYAETVNNITRNSGSN